MTSSLQSLKVDSENYIRSIQTSSDVTSKQGKDLYHRIIIALGNSSSYDDPAYDEIIPLSNAILQWMVKKKFLAQTEYASFWKEMSIVERKNPTRDLSRENFIRNRMKYME